MKSVIIIAIAFVLLFVPMSIAYGSWHWSSDIKICGDKICGEENIEYKKQINTKIPDWVKNIFGWYAQDQVSEDELLNAIKFLINNKIILINQLPMPECSGNAGCIPGIVTKIIDGDTIKVYGKSIRFALTSTPELNEFGGIESKEFIESVCPVGSTVLVDEDDKQTEGSYGRIIGVIYCNGLNLNEELLEYDHGYLSSGFCSNSEFSETDWAQKFGC